MLFKVPYIRSQWNQLKPKTKSYYEAMCFLQHPTYFLMDHAAAFEGEPPCQTRPLSPREVRTARVAVGRPWLGWSIITLQESRDTSSVFQGTKEANDAFLAMLRPHFQRLQVKGLMQIDTSSVTNWLSSTLPYGFKAGKKLPRSTQDTASITRFY